MTERLACRRGLRCLFPVQILQARGVPFPAHEVRGQSLVGSRSLGARGCAYCAGTATCLNERSSLSASRHAAADTVATAMLTQIIVGTTPI